MSLRPCVITDCPNQTGERGTARGYCHSHYHRWQRHGDPLVKKRRDNLTGSFDNGYYLIPVNGKLVREHRYVMEQKLGRKLNRWEEIHHIDHNKLNNDPTNLVTVCGSCNVWYSYHRDEPFVVMGRASER